MTELVHSKRSIISAVRKMGTVGDDEWVLKDGLPFGRMPNLMLVRHLSLTEGLFSLIRGRSTSRFGITDVLQLIAAACSNTDV